MRAVQLEVTTRCNASCAFCPRTVLHDGWLSKDMGMDLFVRIINGIKHKVDLVYLQGWGEPLLNPAILEMIRFAKRRLDTEVGFTTNGSLLDARMIAGILDAGPGVIGVSFAGASPSAHNELRRGCDFDRVVKNTKELVMKGRRAGSDFRIIASYMMTRQSAKDMAGFISLCHEIGIDEVVFNNLSFMPAEELWNWKVFGCHGESPNREAAAGAEEAKELAQSLGMKVFVYSLSCRELASCPEAPLETVYVTVDGEVSPCVYTNLPARGSTVARIFAGKRVLVGKVSFGNAGDRDLEDICSGAGHKRFSQVFKERMRMGADFAQSLSPLFEPASLPLLPDCCKTCYRIFGV